MAKTDKRLIYEQFRWAFDLKAAQLRSLDQLIATVTGATGVLMGLLFMVHRSGDALPTVIFFFGLATGLFSLVFGFVGYRSSRFSIAIPLHPKYGSAAKTYQDYTDAGTDNMVDGWARELSDVLLGREFERIEGNRKSWLKAQTVAAALTLAAVLALAAVSGTGPVVGSSPASSPTPSPPAS